MIPIYRAFSETFDKYILGVPYFSDGRYYMLVDDCNKNNNIGSGSYPIDETTLAIHFPDMLDSKGNKIFASLQEDGKGGDVILEESRLMCNLKVDESAFREFTAIHTMNGNRFTNEKILSDIGSYRDKYSKGYDIMIYDFFMMKKRNIKIIGIQ